MARASVRLLKRTSHAKQAAALTREEMSKAVLETARATLQDAEARMPQLRGTYRIETADGGLSAAVAADHSSIELGTSREPARPHLRPAGEAQREPFRRRVEQAMRRTAKRL